MRVQLAEAGRVHDQPTPLEVAEQLRSRARPHLITRCGAPFYDERAAPRKARRARGTHGRPARYNTADGRSGEPVPRARPSALARPLLGPPRADRDRRADAGGGRRGRRRGTLGAGDPPAFAPVGHRPRDAAAHPGQQALRRQRRVSDRAARRAPDLRAAGTDPADPPRRRHRDGGPAVLPPPRDGPSRPPPPPPPRPPPPPHTPGGARQQPPT